MLKKSGIFMASALILSTTVLSVPQVQADEGREPVSITPGKIGTDKKLGVGLQLGTTSGLNFKYFLTENSAIQATFGGGLSSVGNTLELSVDYLQHPWVLMENSSLSMPLYVGGGVGFWSYVGNDAYYDYNAFHVHGTVGASIEFTSFPADVFLQFEPGILLFSGSVASYFGGSVGGRFYF